ncbi:MAG: hypothetical protein CK426_04870 [Legionella sp.]|nr:MAG: hypothetical protein CK423_04235 [Legionella sp.]PJD98820.1 MAG: hypothetical protein CK426_04870 [Legionella sp.]
MRQLLQVVIYGGALFSSVSFSGIVPSNTEQNVRLRITNQCDTTLWIQQDYKNKTNDPIVIKIPAGTSYDYAIPDEGLASTRFWPKSGCNDHGYNCAVGESTGVPEAEKQGYQQGPYAPDINSKFEATFGCLPAIFNNNPSLCAANPSDPAHRLNAETWWNGSAVDGYTFPYSITVRNHNSSCMDIITGRVLSNPGVDCGKLSVSSCPSDANLSTEGKYNVINGINMTHVNLQWVDKSGSPIGCFSPCSKLTTAQGSDDGRALGGWRNVLGGIDPQSPQAQMYCCPTPPITPESCSAGPAARSSYATSVHATQQCDAYTYAYDDAKGLARCGSQTYFEVTLCPKTAPAANPEPVPSASVSMTMIIPSQVSVLLNGSTVNNNQIVPITNGAVLGIANDATSRCTVGINAQSQVSGFSGEWCGKLVFNNTNKTITFPAASATSNPLKLQFNMNTSVGITAYLNDTLLVNATPLSATDFAENAKLKAYQSNKMGTCDLTIKSNTVERGAGELCSRLNIVNGSNKVDIYLPADIPAMSTESSTPEVSKPKYVVFGMNADTYAYFKDDLVTNGSEIALSHFSTKQDIDLIAYQNQKTASCIIGKAGDTLSIVPNTGTLCHSGLVLITQNNGSYYIGLPSLLPEPTGTKAYGLGIAQGMSVTINNKVIAWNAPDKTVYLSEGVTNIRITGANKFVRDCPVSRYGVNLTWPQSVACQGLVYNGGVIYFPAF